MNETPSLFDDADDVAAARDEALTRVETNADPTWFIAAYQIGVELSRLHAEWSADDFWNRMTDRHPDLTTHEPRVLGALTRAWKRDAVIDRDPVKYVNSRIAKRHGRPIPVHRSLLYAGSVG